MLVTHDSPVAFIFGLPASGPGDRTSVESIAVVIFALIDKASHLVQHAALVEQRGSYACRTTTTSEGYGFRETESFHGNTEAWPVCSLPTPPCSPIKSPVTPLSLLGVKTLVGGGEAPRLRVP